MIQVLGFRYDARNVGKMAVHGVSPRLLDETLEAHYVTPRNRRGRRGLYIFIGTDYEGNCIAAPIQPTDEPGIWRPVTAWYCKPWEWSRL